MGEIGKFQATHQLGKHQEGARRPQPAGEPAPPRVLRRR